MAFPIFGSLFPSTGDHISGVFEVQSELDAKLYSCLRLPRQTPVLIEGAELIFGKISLYDALVCNTEDVLMLSITHDSWWTHVPDLGNCLSPCLIDLCAGTGAMSIGASFLGAVPMVAVDWNPFAVAQISANHKGSVLQLDLSAPDAAKRIHQECQEPPGTALMGFPCQPHSFQGSQRGTADPRAEVLWHGLHIVFMTQVQTLILECTPAAGQNPEVRAGLDLLADAMGWVVLTTTLDLQDLWPCRRHRWWALLIPKHWNQIGLQPWNLQSPFDHVGAIIPNWGCWTLSEELELQLTQFELERFHDVQYGHDVRLLDLQGKASTILHSYANALGPCPCGCRSTAFHEITLRRGGLRGFYVISRKTGLPRYLHPKEAGLLLGLPNSTQYPNDLRTSLALLGLVASPIQTLWIYGHLKQNHSLTMNKDPMPAVEDWMWLYLQELLAQINFDFGDAIPPTHTIAVHAFGAALDLSLSHNGATVQQLLQAERISLGWNESCTIWANNQRLTRADKLLEYFTGNLEIRCQSGLPNRTMPQQPIALAVQHRGELQVHFVQPGRFLFEILAEMSLPLIRKVLDVRGHVLPVDLRVWHPMSVITLEDQPWTQPQGHFRWANGGHSALSGLHDGQVWNGILSLLHETHHPAKHALLIHPALAAAIQHDWITILHSKQLQLDFANSSGHIICIFESRGHWTLLWGELHHDGLHWIHSDGLLYVNATEALDLASSISSVLGLDFYPPCHCCCTPQIDLHTCGTIALVHLYQFLTPGTWISPERVCQLHDWITHQQSTNGVIYATGVIHEWQTDQPRLGLHEEHIWFGMQQLLTAADRHDGTLLVLHPAQVHELLQGHPANMKLSHLSASFEEEIACIFAAQGHWTLLHGRLIGHVLLWTYYDGFNINEDAAFHLAKVFADLLGFGFYPPQLDFGLPQIHAHTCGTIALANFGGLLNLGFVVLPSSISLVHDWLLSLSLPQGSTIAFGLTTLSTDQFAKLTALLIAHGVPEPKAAERANQAIQKLGVPAILAAFVAKNNWAHLKQQANKPGITFRLVQPDELAQHAEKNAITKYGAGISNHKNKKKQDKVASSTPTFDPEALVLQQGNFKDSDGDEVPQIQFSQIEAEAHGIAIATRQQSLQWLQQQDSISASALALLVTEELPLEMLEKYNATKVSFPATYKGTGEPVLIFGTIKNLGDQKVNRHMAGNLTQIDLVDNVVVRLHVYRDELQLQWTELIQSPVRLLHKMLPPLQLCAGLGCGAECPKTHQPIGEQLESVIMEVWGRSFGRIEGGRAPANEASYFSVFLRIPATVLRPLLQTSIAGLYFDPRKDQQPDDQFRVIWLPSHSAAEASHANKTCAKALGLVRMRQKYGVRVATEDEESVFKQLKPEATFIATRVQRTFQLFPLPHGLQRAGLIKILNDLKWVAKPLQPGRGQQAGISWQVGSSEPPPTTIFTSFGKEVLITETTKTPTATRPVTFLASNKTQHHMRTEATTTASSSSGTDPWLEPTEDPWRTWKSPASSAAALKPATGKTHLAEMKDQLRDELRASIRKEFTDLQQHKEVDMEDSEHNANEERFRKIEHTMGEIQAQQTQFNQWFTQVGQATSATETAIQTINYTLSTHQQDLQGLHQEVQKVSDTFSQTLQKTLASHQSEMSADFATRFDKLEAMFAKKQRSE